MSNPWQQYLQNFRANLPAGVTYRSDINRYVFNGKRFLLPNHVIRYRNYILKLNPEEKTYISDFSFVLK